MVLSSLIVWALSWGSGSSSNKVVDDDSDNGLEELGMGKEVDVRSKVGMV